MRILPTGNINYTQAKRFAKHPYVKSFLPIALGDSYKGYRIVGTDKNYKSFYKIKLLEGENISTNFDAVIGYNLKDNLKLRDEFVGSHGLLPSSHNHDENKYKVVGVLEKSNSVVDNLIFTPLESVWLSHAEEESEKEHDHGHHKHEEKPSISTKKSQVQKMINWKLRLL